MPQPENEPVHPIAMSWGRRLPVEPSPHATKGQLAIGDARRYLDEAANNLQLLNQVRDALLADRELVRAALGSLKSIVGLFMVSATVEPVLQADRMELIRSSLEKILTHLDDDSDESLFLPEIPGS